MEPTSVQAPAATKRRGKPGSIDNPEIYDDVQMIRIKLPFGGVSPEQLDAFADVAEHYAPLRKGHITTRQNFQFHHIPLPDAAKAIRMISEAGLSSREACGNTVRNVTGDPWAGVCDELFDITPYA